MNFDATTSPLITSGSLSFPFHEITGQIVAAYVSHHAMQAGEVPQFIAQVYGAVAGLGTVQATSPTTTWPGKTPTPLTPREIKALITPDAIISLEDSKPYKMLRRHLSIIGLTPEQYREKWGLPATFPMTAPNYSAQRSSLAKAAGLGTKGVSH